MQTPVGWWIGVGALAVLAVGVAVWRCVHRRDLSPGLRFVVAVTPLACLLLLLGMVGIVAEVPFRGWSAARLSFAAVMTHGVPLYPGPEEGAVLPLLYGPVMPLLMLPAMVAPDITSAMLIGGTINLLAGVVPMFVLLMQGRWRDPVRRPIAIGACLVTVALQLFVPGPRSMVAGIHVDSTAVGLGLLSCAALLRPDGLAPGGGRLALSALCAVLSVWAKQIEITMVPGQLIWLWVGFGGAVVWRYLLRLALFGALSVPVFVGAFGFENMWFNVFTVPQAHPMAGLFGVLRELSRWSLPLVVVLGLLHFTAPRARRRWVKAPWLLPGLAALTLFPMSWIARAKIGGWMNSYHTLYYMVAAIGLAVLAAAEASRDVDREPLLQRVALPVGMAIALVFMCWPQKTVHRLARLPEVAHNQQRQAYDFAVAHPGQAYFPLNTLSTLMADGELYHYAWSLFDRSSAGVPISEEHWRRHLPPDMKWVLLFKRKRAAGLPERLPGFSRRIELPGMPDWTVYTR